MRLIDADALMETLGITDMDCVKCAWYSRALRRCKRGGDFEDACAAIEDAPTVEERKTGRWIDETFKPWGLVYHPYKCDQCGECSEAESDFCPNCGAKMEE